MKIFITGIRGFLGSQLEHYWTAAGHTVSGTTRRDVTPSLDGYDVVVHAAYDSKAGIEPNVAATSDVYLAAQQAGVPYQIYISSYAARPETQSVYGRMKYQLETLFLDRGYAIVRPGLVIGNGGMFGRNLKKILHSPLIPLLDGGRDLIPVLAIQDFVSAVDLLATQRCIGAYNLFNRELIPMRKLVETINHAAGRRPLLVDIPLNLALTLLTITERLHIPFPAGSDNVRSLKQSLPHVYQTDLETLIQHPCPFDKMIESAVRHQLSFERGHL